jgi:hypothetical protein
LRRAEPLQPVRRERRQKGSLVGEMAIDGGRADPHGARHFAQREIVRRARFKQAQARLDQCRAQITVVVLRSMLTLLSLFVMFTP